jgi:hypothetical protein
VGLQRPRIPLVGQIVLGQTMERAVHDRHQLVARLASPLLHCWSNWVTSAESESWALIPGQRTYVAQNASSSFQSRLPCQHDLAVHRVAAPARARGLERALGAGDRFLGHLDVGVGHAVLEPLQPDR